jgi:nitroreductase
MRRCSSIDRAGQEFKCKIAAGTAVQVMARMLGLETLWLGNPDLIDMVGGWDEGIEKILG